MNHDLNHLSESDLEKHFKEDRFVLGKKKENANETALTGTTFTNNDRKPRSGDSLPIP